MLNWCDFHWNNATASADDNVDDAGGGDDGNDDY